MLRSRRTRAWLLSISISNCVDSEGKSYRTTTGASCSWSWVEAVGTRAGLLSHMKYALVYERTKTIFSINRSVDSEVTTMTSWKWWPASSLTHSLTHSLPHSLTHSLAHSLTHSLTLSLWILFRNDSLSALLLSLTHSLTLSLSLDTLSQRLALCTAAVT